MSKLATPQNQRGYDASGYQKQSIILVVPVTIDGSGDFVGKFVFLTAYNCYLQEYTDYSIAISLTQIEGDSDYDTQFYIVSIPTTQLTSYIENQDTPGYVNSGQTPINITQQNICTSYHLPNNLGYIHSWIDLNDNPISFSTIHGNEFIENLSYYNNDDEPLNESVAIFNCPNRGTVSYKIPKNKLTYEQFFQLIYNSINES